MARYLFAGFVLSLLGILFTVFDAVMPFLAMTPQVTLGFLVAGGVLAGPLLLARRMRVRDLMASVALFAAFLGWIVSLPRTDWLDDPRRPFARAFAAIRPGMTDAEVDAQVRRQFGPTAPAPGRAPGVICYTLDPTDGRYNAECIWIVMKDDRVLRAKYLPD